MKITKAVLTYILLLVSFWLAFTACSLAVAQDANTSYHNSTGFLKTIHGEEIRDRVYDASLVDTTISLPCRDFAGIYVTLQTADSASLHISYQISTDNILWGTATEADSLSTESDAGEAKITNFTTACSGANFCRFIIAQPSDFNLGTTSATYSAFYVLKKY